MTDNNEIWKQCIVAGIFGVCCFCFFHFFFPYHLFIKEQSQLFLLTADYFISYFSKPAWLANYTGDFFTQFFYLHRGGATVITIVLLIEWFLIVNVLKRLGIKTKITLLALIPVIIECVLHCQLHYTLSSSLSVIIVLLIFLLYSFVGNKWVSAITGLLMVPGLYSIAGASFFIFPILVIWYEISKKEWNWLYWLLLIVFIGIYPFIIRHPYLLTVKQAYRYPHTFIKINDISVEREKVFALATEAYREDWNKVMELADKYQLQHSMATYYTNIALSKQDQLADKLLDYYQPGSQGLFLSSDPTSGWLKTFFSSDVYFHIGDINMAKYTAMTGLILSPKQMSSRMVKRLAEVCLINGDSAATRKYVRMLDATLFHKSWGAQHVALLADDNNSLIKIKRSLVPKYDILRNTTDHVASLNVLIRSNPENHYALNYLLCYHLLNKDLASFISAFDTWCKEKPEYLSDLYCEALLLQFKLEKVPDKVVRNYHIPEEMVHRFKEYMDIFDNDKNRIDVLKERYSKSYWFYYHFNNKE